MVSLGPNPRRGELHRTEDELRRAEECRRGYMYIKKIDVDINSRCTFHLPHILPALELFVCMRVRARVHTVPVALFSMALPELYPAATFCYLTEISVTRLVFNLN